MDSVIKDAACLSFHQTPPSRSLIRAFFRGEASKLPLFRNRLRVTPYPWGLSYLAFLSIGRRTHQRAPPKYNNTTSESSRQHYPTQAIIVYSRMRKRPDLCNSLPKNDAPFNSSKCKQRSTQPKIHGFVDSYHTVAGNRALLQGPSQANSRDRDVYDIHFVKMSATSRSIEED
ncbi:hypothetical protein P153DRAFT_178651 [Dothidotthia symphoricarpi CBS 119687]|uniref:Uncharacterized protein n=1 Tax=Dothidotthia symphoricarpi CBS 119687 TaxID=1392245 RepID=A0A6A6AQ18_9PLEO|nr:uncharacterized protein P153DRAFT_178651 [Dothidotthia symphoricarpi CBS 119687]KAF2133044.1 hypothetical protein P153DRAFT_178651 [Dothidotthia symphoricarpi CBS 119687]